MVKIGTPMTAVGKKALLCGSGELGKEVTIELQRYGIEVVACDRYYIIVSMYQQYLRIKCESINSDGKHRYVGE